MKQFLLNIIIFSILFLVFDRSFLIIRNYSPKTQKDKRLELVLNGKMNKDLLIFGSSRGARDLYAYKIQKELGFNTYNLSYPGGDIEFQEFLLKSVLKFNLKPKKVILVLDDRTEFLINKVKYRLDVLYPLVKYKFIRDELVKRGEKNKILSKLFVLHQLNKANFKLKKQIITPLDTILNNGSMLISFQAKNVDWTDNSKVFFIKENEIESKVKSFLNFQKLCLDNNIQLILVFPPNYYDLSQNLLDQILFYKNNKTLLYIYDQHDARYKNKDYFYNSSHLKKNGAIIFTNEIISFLKNN